MVNLTAVGNADVDNELARRVEAAQPQAEPIPPLPPAEIPWRPATDLEVTSCKSAASLRKKAREAGYEVQAHFARGPFIGADGQPLDTADALTLVFRWTHVEAFATWYRRKAKWELGAAYAVRPHVALGGNDLGHWLCGTQPATKKKEAA